MKDNITAGHFELSAEQRQFKHMLSNYPRFSAYWDFESRCCDLESAGLDIGALSHGEQIMLRFFAAVWLGENALNFDLIEATRVLDDNNLDDIRQWLANPVFP